MQKILLKNSILLTNTFLHHRKIRNNHLAQNALCDIRNSDLPKLSILLILMKWQNIKKLVTK